MEGETAIEKSIKEFVFSKIQEQVCLDISKKSTVSIKHRSKHGSIALAMFWLRVLRHQNNYPMPKYPYKDLYDKQGNNKIILKVDNVTITAFMSTGTLMIQGLMVLEWFVNTFQIIMDAYDAPIREPQPNTTVYRQYTENWKKLEEHYEAKHDEEEKELRAREEVALAILDHDNSSSASLREGSDLPISEESGAGDAEAVTVKTTSMSDKTLQAADEVAEQMELMSLDVWPAETLQQQLDKLRSCCIKDGQFYIYTLWKSLLTHWFSDPSCKVYIVTPFLDAKRLTDVCQIILDHRITANLDCFYVRQNCDHNQRIFEVKQAALKKFDAKDQMFLEYKIYSNIIYPVKRFHAKFIAAVKENEVEVLVTSANFHGDHFECSNMDSVLYQTMSEGDFVKNFLSPINASMQVQK